MSFLGNLLGGKASQQGTQVITNEPPEYALPYLEDALSRAEEVYNKPKTFYGDPTYTDFSQPTLDALSAGEARARAGSTLLGGAQDFVGGAQAGDYTNPALAMLGQTAAGDFLGRNEYLDAAMQPALDRIKGQFSQGGRLGSGANIGAMTSAMAPVYAENYARERANQLAAQRSIGQLSQQDMANRFRAAGMAPTLAEADYADIGKLAGFGQVREGKEAEILQDKMARFNFAQNEQDERLRNFLASVRGGTYGGTQSQPIYGNSVASGIGNLAGLGQAAYFGSKAFPSLFS